MPIFCMLVASYAFADNNISEDGEQSFGQTTTLEKYIAQEILGKESRHEHTPAAREYTHMDLDRDGKYDLLVTILTSYGGTHHDSTLLVLLTSQKNRVQRIDFEGRGYKRAKRFVKGGPGHLFLEFDIWARSDSECCPSLSTT